MERDGRPHPAVGRGLEADANDRAIQQAAPADARTASMRGVARCVKGDSTWQLTS